jgi:outer membrane protein
MQLRLLKFIVVYLVSASLYAVDLMDIYKQSLENDTFFKRAYNEYMSSAEAIPQAKAALYPQVNLNAGVSRNHLDAFGENFNIRQGYDAQVWQFRATQAIFNFNAWFQVKLAKASVKAAQAMFNDAAQDLMLRTAQAYLSVLLAQDNLNFTEAKKRANKRQLDQAKERFDVGVVPITTVYEARASYDQSIAEVIGAKNDAINKQENLRKLTNHVYDNIAPLKNNQIPLIKPEPNNVDDWIDTSLKQNYKYYAAKYKLDAARDNIKTQASSAWPVINLSGNAQGAKNDINYGSSSFFVPNEQNAYNIALGVSVPLFQGGLVESKVRQAQYDFAAAGEELERIYRDVTVNSKIAYNSIIDGISKVKADRQTLKSQTISLESIEAQFEVGTRTMIDVLNGQRRLLEAQVQLASDQYQLIMAVLQLKYLSGTLCAQDLEEINSWLE